MSNKFISFTEGTSRREMIRDDLYLSQEQKDDIIKNMQHNTIDFTGLIQSCDRRVSLSDGELSLVLRIYVTGGEEEAMEVDKFISDIKSRENIRIQIVRENE